MNSLSKVAAPSRGTSGLALVKRVSGVPFPYVVLGGRDDISEAGGEAVETGKTGSENQRAWFAAHVELSAPRWNDARQALVRSLATPSGSAAVAPEQDDAAWDGRVTMAPILKEAPAPVVVAQPSPIKLRAKRRAPTLATTPAVVDASGEKNLTTFSEDAGFPLLAEGSAPLVPIPLVGGPVSTALATRLRLADLAPVPLPKRAPTQPADGRLQKVTGMVLLCALLSLAGFLVFQEFVAPMTQKSAEATVVTSAPQTPSAAVVMAAPVPEVIEPAAMPVAPEVVEPVTVVEEPAKPAAPVQASQAFADYVAGLKISGVSLGASPRALINGRAVHLDDLLDPALEVRLVAIDGGARHLVFEDRSSARIQMRY